MIILMKKIILLISVNLFFFQLYSQEKIFVREYTYTAGETDSKISSREKALEQVKSILLEELGTYVESYVNYNVNESEKISESFFQQEIKTISAGTTETKILDETWNGYEFYIKAQIKANPEEVVRRINQTLSARRSSAVIDSLKLLLSSSNQEIQVRNQELEKIKAQLNSQNKEIQTKQTTLNSLNQQLSNAKQQLSIYQAQEKQILTEIETIENRIKSATRTALNNVRIGMTPTEVKQVSGNPRSTENCSTNLYYNYGDVWIMFESNIVVSVFSAQYFIGPCYSGTGKYRERNIK